MKLLLPIIGLALFYFLWRDPSTQLAVKAITKIDCPSNPVVNLDSFYNVINDLKLSNEDLRKKCRNVSNRVDTILKYQPGPGRIDSVLLYPGENDFYALLLNENEKLKKSLLRADELSEYLANRPSEEIPILQRQKRSLNSVSAFASFQEPVYYGIGYKRWLSDKIGIGLFGTYSMDGKIGGGAQLEVKF